MTSGRPDYNQMVITTSRYISETKIGVVDTASEHTLQGESKAVEIYNDGANVVYMEINTTATTNSRPIRPRTSRAMDVDASTISLICGSDNTATVYITELG